MNQLLLSDPGVGVGVVLLHIHCVVGREREFKRLWEVLRRSVRKKVTRIRFRGRTSLWFPPRNARGDVPPQGLYYPGCCAPLLEGRAIIIISHADHVNVRVLPFDIFHKGKGKEYR
jgi:hypothetical protein